MERQPSEGAALFVYDRALFAVLDAGFSADGAVRNAALFWNDSNQHGL
jgi:hypothetical protein